MLYIGLILLVFLGKFIAEMTNLWFGLAFFIAAAGSFIYQGIKNVKADPIHYALRTLFGKRTKKVKKEGYRFFALNPWVEGFIPVKMTKINQDFSPEDVRTPDRAELDITAALTFTPDENELIDYLNAGGEQGVKNILDDIVPERIRQWAISTEEGPQDFMEARGMSGEAIAMLLKAIIGENLTEIPDYAQSIPTTLWLKFFPKPRILTKKKDIDTAGQNWEKVNDLFWKLSPEQRIELREAVEKRREEINAARIGNGIFYPAKTGLGIKINRLNVPLIKEKGELAKAAELEAIEIQQRKSEVYEVDTDILKANQLMEAAKKAEQPLSFQDAYRVILEWKTAREGHGFTIPGVSPAIIELARTLLGRRDK